MSKNQWIQWKFIKTWFDFVDVPSFIFWENGREWFKSKTKEIYINKIDADIYNFLFIVHIIYSIYLEFKFHSEKKLVEIFQDIFEMIMNLWWVSVLKNNGLYKEDSNTLRYKYCIW